MMFIFTEMDLQDSFNLYYLYYLYLKVKNEKN